MSVQRQVPGLARRRHRRRPAGLHRRGQRGRGRPRHHPPAAGHPDARPRRPVELQGRQVRLVQRRDQRPAAADVHDPDEHVHRGRDRHGHAAARVPGDPRPGHRRVLQLREGARRSRRSRRPTDLAPGEYRMQQVDVERSQEFRKCIECFLCQNTCHVVRDHEENKEAFAGPRFFIRLAELDMHPLDAARPQGVGAGRARASGMCNITKCCTEVCPEHIKITDNAIIPMKERVVDTKYDPLTLARRARSAAAARRRGELTAVPRLLDSRRAGCCPRRPPGLAACGRHASYAPSRHPTSARPWPWSPTWQRWPRRWTTTRTSTSAGGG